jgi:hypothetical protein
MSECGASPQLTDEALVHVLLQVSDPVFIVQTCMLVNHQWYECSRADAVWRNQIERGRLEAPPPGVSAFKTFKKAYCEIIGSDDRLSSSPTLRYVCISVVWFRFQPSMWFARSGDTSTYSRALHSTSPFVRAAFRFTDRLKPAYLCVLWALALTAGVVLAALHYDGRLSLFPVGSVVSAVSALNIVYFLMASVRPLLLHASYLTEQDPGTERRRMAALADTLGYLFAAIASACSLAYGLMLLRADEYTRVHMAVPLAIGIFIVSMWSAPF